MSLAAEPIATERLVLTGLSVEDADEMVRVLNDEALYEFIGGRPPTRSELRHRYRELVTGPHRPRRDLAELGGAFQG